jgi:hypothetical protein
MKAILALALLVVVVGCGAVKKAAVISGVKSGSVPGHASKVPFAAIVVSGTTTLPDVKTGTVIVCSGGQPRAKVPKPNEGVSVGYGMVTSSGKVHNSTRNLQMTRLPSGAVTVSCTR